MTKTAQLLKKSQHSPTLKTIVMVEDTLKNTDLITLAKLKKTLPKKVMHQTLIQILDYLQISGKILIGTKGILWIYTPREELERLKREGIEM